MSGLEMRPNRSIRNSGTLRISMTHDAAVTTSLPAATQFADKVLAGETIKPVCTPEAE